jgi:putative ABC transport system permease protein
VSPGKAQAGAGEYGSGAVSSRRPAPPRNVLQSGLALRLAYSGLVRSRGTTALAVAVLALGLAAPTVFFSLLVGATRPLPVPDGERVVRIDIVQPARDGRALAVEPGDLRVLSGVGALQALGAFRTSATTIVDADVAASRVALAELSPEVLPLLGVAPLVGRVARRDEADRTLLIGNDVWLEMYDGDPAALGRTVTIAGAPRTIVGVMPEGFGFPFKQNAWILFDPANEAAGDAEPVELVGRLSEGASTDAATDELGVRWTRADGVRDLARAGGVVRVKPYTGGRGEGGEAAAFIGLVLVALALLVIACANVANLLLVRAAERVRALGIQSALGASRVQIGTQLFLESLILALIGGALGLLLAHGAVDSIQRRLAVEHFGYFWMRMAVDGPVVAFTTVLVVATAVAAGTLPAIRVMSVDIRSVLQREGAAGGVSAGGSFSRIFVTTQLALSCAALVAAGLTARSMVAWRDFAGDVPAEQILIANVSFDAESGIDPARVRVLEEGLDRIAGVRSAAVAIGAPGFFEQWGPLELDAVEYALPEDRDRILWNAVTPGYSTVIDSELRAGRLLTSQDVHGSAPVALVNESFVRRFSPDRDVVGRSVRIGSRPDSTVWRTVVGVVSDSRVGSGELVRHDRVYLPLAQVPSPSGIILLRGADDPTVLVSGLRRAVAAVDPDIAISGVRTLAEGYTYILRVPRAMGALALGGGLAGLLVASVGLYGLLAFRVRQRRRELGVRLALGADGRRLAYETLSVALHQLVPAIAVGLLLAWLAGPLLSIIALGVDPRSPSTLAAVGIAFLTVGLVAAAIPTLRAAATDPAAALRAE